MGNGPRHFGGEVDKRRMHSKPKWNESTLQVRQCTNTATGKVEVKIVDTTKMKKDGSGLKEINLTKQKERKEEKKKQERDAKKKMKDAKREWKEARAARKSPDKK